MMDYDQHDVANRAANAGMRLILLHGKAASGKTTLAVNWFRENALPFEKVTATVGDMKSEYTGMFVPKGDRFDWMHGILTRCWVEGKGIVIDEFDHFPDECKSALHNFLDDPDIASYTLVTGETVAPQPGFRVFATMNADPLDIDEPLRSRFHAKIRIDYPSPKMYETLPADLRDWAKREIEKSEADLAAEKRQQRLTFREMKTFAAYRSRLPEDVAAMAVFGDNWRDVLTTMRLATV